MDKTPEYIISEIKSIEAHMIQIQNDIYFANGKYDPTGSIDHKMINLHQKLQIYTSLAITKYNLEQDLKKVIDKQ